MKNIPSMIQVLTIVGIGIFIFILTSNIDKIIEKFTCFNDVPMMNAHGSEPPGFGASPGNIEQHQNANASHVNRMYKDGNPQNTNPEFKLQPT